jgi:Kef-type K+ transport system membrane component KefB
VKHARNVAILLLIALAITAIPGGGTVADLFSAVLSLALAALVAYFVGRLYRDHRVDVYGLGDLDRGILYAAIAGIVVALAAAQEFNTTTGSLIELAALAVCAGALLKVFQAWRSY